MQKIKLIALDLDGTLLNDKKKISSKSICAMKKLINKGIYIVPTSGRISNDEIVQKELVPIGVRYFIGENGGIIKDCIEHKNLKVVSMNLFESIDLIKKLEEEQIFTYFVSNEKLYQRWLSIVKTATNCSEETAIKFYEKSHHNAKAAICMIKLGYSYKEAIVELEKNDGFVKRVLNKI